MGASFLILVFFNFFQFNCLPQKKNLSPSISILELLQRFESLICGTTSNYQLLLLQANLYMIIHHRKTHLNIKTFSKLFSVVPSRTLIFGMLQQGMSFFKCSYFFTFGYCGKDSSIPQGHYLPWYCLLY